MWENVPPPIDPDFQDFKHQKYPGTSMDNLNLDKKQIHHHYFDDFF